MPKITIPRDSTASVLHLGILQVQSLSKKLIFVGGFRKHLLLVCNRECLHCVSMADPATPVRLFFLLVLLLQL